MNRDQRSSSQDPTAERTTDQSTQSASGLPMGSGEQGRGWDEDVVNRAPLDTPRRYEQPIADDEDPVMPSDDATMNTKI